MKTLVLLPALVLACAAQSNPAPRVGPPKSQNSQMAELQKEVSSLKEQNEALWTAVRKDGFDISEMKHASVELDLTSPGQWLQLDSGAGMLLLVSLQKVEPRGNGCAVELNIGNPFVVTFKGFTVNATWTHKKTDAEKWPDWFKSQKHQQFTFTDDLVSGRWNKAVLLLSGTKREDLGYLSISLKVNTVSLETLLRR